MFIVLGATGHIGSVVADTLLAAGESVTVVTRSAEKAENLIKKGAKPAVVDVTDSRALASVFRTGKRAFLLNPPASVSRDTDAEEHKTLEAIISALDEAGLEKIVLASVYGAHSGTRCGDLTVLYDFEQALKRQPVPITTQRAAYYMSNFDELLKPAREGVLPSMFPADFVLPMIAPADLGRAAAGFLREPTGVTGLHYVEGPERYTIRDVANAFAVALGRPVNVKVTPREDWTSAYKKLGFSDAAAQSYACMTGVTLDSAAFPKTPVRGTTTLQSYITRLIERAPS